MSKAAEFVLHKNVSQKGPMPSIPVAVMAMAIWIIGYLVRKSARWSNAQGPCSTRHCADAALALQRLNVSLATTGISR